MSSFKIYTLWWLCASVLASAKPAPEAAAITAAPVIPRSPLEIRSEREYRAMLHYQARALMSRQTKPGLSVCFGTGSICDLSLDMQCSFSLEGDEWYKCQCTSGRVSTNAACQACQDFYDLGGSFKISDWAGPEGYCAEKGFELAPVPSSVMSSWSKYNATMTANTARPTGTASVTSARGSGSAGSTSARAGATGSASLDLPTVSLSRTGTRTSQTGTLTFLGDPTGTFRPTPLTTTTGTPPLQLAPAGSGASVNGNVELLKLMSGGVTAFAVIIGIIMAI